MSRSLGVDIGGTNTKIVVLDAGGAVLRRGQIPTAGSSGPASCFDSIEAAIAALEAETGPVTSIGISFAGLVDRCGRVLQAPNLPAFEGVDVRQSWRQRRPGIPVAVENDVNSALLAEALCGAGRGTGDLCMLSLGTGVGGAILVDGRLVHGAHGLAGELGHLILQSDGPLCTCGQAGHVESYLSTAAIVDHALAALEAASRGEGAPLRAAIAAGERPEPRVLARCARAGCGVSRRVLADAGRWLGIACVQLAHALDPDRILIGGGVSRAGELLLDPAREEYDRRCMRAVRGRVPLVLAELGVDGAAIGAALLGRDVMDSAGNRNETPPPAV